ncbi:MAG: hypothetical protein ABW156_12805 [Jiangellaceae bacterium]
MEFTLVVAAGTFVVAGTTLLLGRLDKRREKQKRVEVAVTDTRPWPQKAVDQQAWNQLQVQWGQTRVADPRVVQVEFRNVGRIELKDSDMFESPAVEVIDGTIITASAHLMIKGSSGPRPRNGIAQNGNRVEAPKQSLNPGDSLVFQLLVDGGTRPPTFDLRAGGFEVVNRDVLSAAGGGAFFTKLFAILSGAVAATVVIWTLFLNR